MRSLLLFLLALPLHSQWTLHDAHTTADLRGVDAVGKDVIWVSGSAGTVLRSEDGGLLWQICAVPPGGDKLDFRGVQGYDANTAVIMASGKGALSRIYKTTDGCQTWKKVFDNPDADGFFDSLRRVTDKQLFLLGDPVAGKFAMFTSRDAGSTWFIADDPGLEAPTGSGAFAASNSALASAGPFLFFGTGGINPFFYNFSSNCPTASAENCPAAWQATRVPMAHGSETTGVYSIAGRFTATDRGAVSTILVAVGGDYKKPADSVGVCAWSLDSGDHWIGSTVQPHGYRSAVAYDRTSGKWIAVGPSGTDVSTDDAHTWQAVKPGPGDPPDADQHWNALSPPFAVGPHGRIGTLNLPPK